DGGLVQARLQVLRIELRCLLKVQESLLVVTSIERDEAQVVPDERALRVQIRGLAEGRFRKIQLAHFIVGETQSVISNDCSRNVSPGRSPLRKELTGLFGRLFQVARLT